MERSSRFLSLSGLSGVGAGMVALLAATVGHFYLQSEFPEGYLRLMRASAAERQAALPFLLLLAGGTIAAALLVAFFFTRRRTHRSGQTPVGAARPAGWPWPWPCRWWRVACSACASTWAAMPPW